MKYSYEVEFYVHGSEVVVDVDGEETVLCVCEDNEVARGVLALMMMDCPFNPDVDKYVEAYRQNGGI